MKSLFANFYSSSGWEQFENIEVEEIFYLDMWQYISPDFGFVVRMSAFLPIPPVRSCAMTPLCILEHKYMASVAIYNCRKLL